MLIKILFISVNSFQLSSKNILLCKNNNPLKKTDNLPIMIIAALKAGDAIIDVYNTDFGVEKKSDNSPLTIADKNAHKIIEAALNETNIPILSEEGRLIPFEERDQWNTFWMVDPLDGTKEFIKRNGEFTVNIALIENGKPVAGVVYAPVPETLYFGELNSGAYKIENARQIIKGNKLSNWREIGIKLPEQKVSTTYKIVASRSHLSVETSSFIKEVEQEKQAVEIVSIGSSLKLCLIASGEADIYPRFAPTMEWDTAAGHAIINAAGGKVVQAKNKETELCYNKPNLLNPWFIAYL